MLKKNRLLLTLQILVTLPLVLFILIYLKFTLLSALSTLVLLFLLTYNIYRYTKKLSVLNPPLLAILVGSFLLYAYHDLGSTTTPQTYEILQISQKVNFKFQTPQSIDKVCYYISISKTVNFELSYLKDEKFQMFHEYNKNFPLSYRWECIDANITASQLRLNITKSKMMLNEVRFMYKGETLAYTTDKTKLNDEQNTSIDTTYYGGMFFDEIYHSRTAYEIIHNIKIYENTHPYLGKLLIIPGIKLFDMTPFGWRFTNVLFAALMIVLAYYFSLNLFKRKIYAFTTALLMTYSFMHLTQSRIGLIDTFGVFFVLLSYFFLYRFIIKQKLSWLLLSGIFFGLASAVKWSAVFSALGFVFIALYLLITKYPLKKEFSGYKLLLYGVLSYGVLSIVTYTLTFYDVYLQTHSFQKIIEYQINMFNYHLNVQSAHAYSSSWWSWPLNYRPMCYYREETGLMYRSITVFGNPAIFWTGIIAIFYLMYLFFKKRTLESSFILLAFLGLYTPYIFVGREMFIYHFYYAMPFMVLALVYMIKDILKRFPLYRNYYYAYLAVLSILFLAYYPVLTGYEVPKAYVMNVLKWFPGWWF